MKKSQYFIVLLFASQLLNAQISKSSFLIGTDFPSQYTAGYNVAYNRFNTQFQAGLLTTPYNNIVLGIIENFGANPNIVEIVRESYKKGLIFTLKQQYHFDKMYFGIYGQHLTLNADAIPLDIVQDYYNINLTSYWASIPFFSTLLNYGDEITKIQLESKMWQGGILVGRRFPFSNPSFEFRAEFSVSKNFASNNTFTSQTPYPESLYQLIDEDIQETYKKYAYIPSLNFYLMYRF